MNLTRNRAPILIVVSRNSLQFQIRDLRRTERQTYSKFKNNRRKNINVNLSLCPELLARWLIAASSFD